jgi:iron(II)-dependent oxidoreductase
MESQYEPAPTASQARAWLAEARSHTLRLIEPLDEADLRRQHSPLMSPIVWDLGHIAHFEEVWLLENLDEGAVPGREGLRGMYDPFRHPRATREGLDLPDRARAEAYLADVRAAVLERLESTDFGRAESPLLRHGFVLRMVLQHEYQHNETILQTLQLKQGRPYTPPERLPFGGQQGMASGPGHPRAQAGDVVRFAGGEVSIGTDDRSTAYDNERGRHVRTLAPFEIDVHPVTNGRYLDFMADGGYKRPELWCPEGWAWREETGVEAPRYWERHGPRWLRRSFDRRDEVDPRQPVVHVTWWEADAWCRWAGRRLPTEFEWEAAATWDPTARRARRYPWGDAPATPDLANLDARAFDVAPIGQFPAGASPIGCQQMIGDVWEWTASHFEPYPGYETFPYPEYSEAFFGSEYRVLRGGSWATRPGAIRGTFRNWDYPMRSQIFSGFRSVADV